MAKQKQNGDVKKKLAEKLVTSNQDWFELHTLRKLMDDIGFFMRVRDQLCVHNGETTRDFSKWEYNTLYGAVKDFNNLHSDKDSNTFKPINRGLLEMVLKSFADAGHTIREAEVPEVMGLYDRLMTLDMAAYDQVCDAGFPYWLSRQKIKNLMKSADSSATWEPDEIAENTHAAAALAHGLGKKESRLTFFSAFGMYDSEDIDAERLSSGFSKLNECLGGSKVEENGATRINKGFAKGDAYLFIAPSGAGKTVMATQFAQHFASSNKNGLFISTEQGPYELVPRIISARCNIPFELLSNGMAEARKFLNENQMADVLSTDAVISEKLIFSHWMEPSMSVLTSLDDEIESAKEIFESRGERMDFVVFDWVGGALGELTGDDATKLRLLYQLTADGIADMAIKHNIVAITFAQAMASKGYNTMKVGTELIAECKSMGQKYAGIIGITALYDNKEQEASDTPIFSDKQFFFVQKTRKGRGSVVPIKRNFKYQRFEEIH